MTVLQILESCGPLDEKILRNYESQWGFVLPHQYRQFLLQYNGGLPRPDGFNFKGKKNGSDVQCFYGITDDADMSLIEELESYKNRLPTRLFPIANDSGGNLICISVIGNDIGKIYFWDHEREADTKQAQSPDEVKNIVLIADSFGEFLEGLFADEHLE